MLKFVKAAHLLGVVMFFGSILGHVTVGLYQSSLIKTHLMGLRGPPGRRGPRRDATRIGQGPQRTRRAAKPHRRPVSLGRSRRCGPLVVRGTTARTAPDEWSRETGQMSLYQRALVLVPGAKDDPQTALFVRQVIDGATTYLTMPGLVLLLVTGIFMIVKGKLPIFKMRWLALHAGFGLLIVLNAVFVLYPAGQELLDTASQAAAGALPMEQLHAIGGREAAFGAANLLLCLTMVIIAVVKPRIGQAI